MKHLYKLISGALALAAAFSATGCMEADPEFVHTTTTISALYCVSADYSTQQVTGTIYEYDKDGNIVSEDITEEAVAGGYGLIIVKVPYDQADYIDITRCKLRANLDLDEFVTPSLSGYKDISGDGIIVTVEQRSAGTSRKYRIRGEYGD